jgi:hypothetical protein
VITWLFGKSKLSDQVVSGSPVLVTERVAPNPPPPLSQLLA